MDASKWSETARDRQPFSSPGGTSAASAVAEYQPPHIICLSPRRFEFDGVDPVRVKRQVFPDCRYGDIRSFVAPDGVDRAFSAGRNAVISALALVGTIRLVRGPLQLRHIDVLARNVLHQGIGRFLQGQGLAAIGDAFAVHGDRDPAFGRRDGHWMIRPWNPDWLAVHDLPVLKVAFGKDCISVQDQYLVASFV